MQKVVNCRRLNINILQAHFFSSRKMHLRASQIIHDAPQINKNVISGRKLTSELLCSTYLETIKKILSFTVLKG